jgi:hypothetical protein
MKKIIEGFKSLFLIKKKDENIISPNAIPDPKGRPKGRP